MSYKPRIGDLVEYTDKRNRDKKIVAVVMKINREREFNGTVNLKLVFEDDKVKNYINSWDLKLLSKAS